MKKHIASVALICLLLASLCLPAGPALALSHQNGGESGAPASAADYARYELKSPPYTYDEEASAYVPQTVAANRFVLRDGVYINPSAPRTKRATLFITGDLLCQFGQQSAAFKSDGKDYTSLEELKPAADYLNRGGPGRLGVVPQPTGRWDFTPSFRYVKSLLAQGDLVIGNLETAISQSSPLGMQLHRTENKPYLNAPSSYLDALKYAGFDLLTMANNHNCDAGVRGIYETIENVESRHFLHTGLYTGEEAQRYLLIDVNGLKLGMSAYACYFNGKQHNLTEAGRKTLLSPYDEAQVKADIEAMRKAGAEFIITFIHWGSENTNEVNSRQKAIAKEIANAGSDYIVGSHPHAVQPYGTVRAKDGRIVPVLYSMGNFVSSMTRDINKDGLLLQLNLAHDEQGKVRVTFHRLYPTTIVSALPVKEYGLSRELSYVVIPQEKKYRPALSEADPAQKAVLEELRQSGTRVSNVLKVDTLLPLPQESDPKEKIQDAAALWRVQVQRLTQLAEREAAGAYGIL